MEIALQAAKAESLIYTAKDWLLMPHFDGDSTLILNYNNFWVGDWQRLPEIQGNYRVREYLTGRKPFLF